MTLKPTLPDEIIKESYMKLLSLSITILAGKLLVSREILSPIINERIGVTPDALRLARARAFSTTPGLWLNMQQHNDLWLVENAGGEWQKVEPIYAPPQQDEATA